MGGESRHAAPACSSRLVCAVLQLHEELKRSTGQRTVPYVYINGALVGGCDATKALIASGEFDKRVGGAAAGAGACCA